MSKKLKLDILDPTYNITTTHHFDFDAGHGNKLMLTIEDKKYLLDTNGRLISIYDKDK